MKQAKTYEFFVYIFFKISSFNYYKYCLSLSLSELKNIRYSTFLSLFKEYKYKLNNISWYIIERANCLYVG